MRTHALSLMQHLQCLGIASLTLVIGLIVKFIPIDTSEPVAYGADQDKPVEASRKKTSFGYSSRGGMKLNANLSKKGSRN